MPRSPDLVDGPIIFAADLNTRYDEAYEWVDTVDANGHNLTDVGTLDADQIGIGTASPAAPLHIISAAPGATQGNRITVETVAVIDGGNGISLVVEYYRTSAGSGHSTLASRIFRRVDATQMGYVEFGSNYVSLGNEGLGEQFRVQSDGTIQMRLGGTLKTLSVDGSGFVKAT